MRKLQTLDIKEISHLALRIDIDEKELLYLEENAEKLWRSWLKSRPGKKPRRIWKAHRRLRRALDGIKGLLGRLELPDHMYGGVKGRSHRDNAAAHVGQDLVINRDIESFFPSVSHKRVYRLFLELGCSPRVASMLTRLTTDRFQLPQGSPTSSALANLALVPAGRRIQGLAKKHGGRYTQYVDDTTVSGPRHLSKVAPKLDDIVREHGFRVNAGKSTEMPRGGPQVVTGLRVDQGLNVPPGYVRAVRKMIEALERGEAVKVASIRGKIRYVGEFDSQAARSLNRRLVRVLRAQE